MTSIQIQRRTIEPQPLPPACTADGAIIPLPLSHAVTPGDAAYSTWFVRLPRQYSIEHVLKPELWRKVEVQQRQGPRRPAPGDLMRVVASDGSFDAVFLVEDISGGYRLNYYCGHLPTQETT